MSVLHIPRSLTKIYIYLEVKRKKWSKSLSTITAFFPVNFSLYFSSLLQCVGPDLMESDKKWSIHNICTTLFHFCHSHISTNYLLVFTTCLHCFSINHHFVPNFDLSQFLRSHSLVHHVFTFSISYLANIRNSLCYCCYSFNFG